MDEDRFGERLEPLRGEGSFDHAVGLYASAVRELYLIADELERRVRAVVYGSPTPRLERTRGDVTTAVRQEAMKAALKRFEQRAGVTD